ncbi:hypothetical protein ACGFZQ_25485 [Streptomyces sp. NPDC048254]|uniref:hypothetical protein n=1 Tax=Streptomyces sp. NPDC048254 TaxID=3365525 RepID=UPI00371478F0
MRRNALRLAGRVCLLTAALGLTVPGTATAEPTRTARVAAAALPQFRSVTPRSTGGSPPSAPGTPCCPSTPTC